MGRLNNQDRFRRDVINWLNDLTNTLTKKAEKYAEDLREQLNIIAESTIEDFYDDYLDRKYKPVYDIYNTYKITVEIDQFEINYDIDFSPEYMQHHGDLNGYLFDIVFVEGWHGGADKGSGHPEPDVPWYRNLSVINKAGKNYKELDPSGFWLRRAERSFSPYEEISNKMDNFISKWEKKYQYDLEQYFKKKLDEFKVILKQRKRR